MEERQEDHKLEVQVTAEAGEPWGLGPQRQEGRYVPLPLGGAKEQAINHSLQEELSANMKLLEVGGARPHGTGAGVIPRSGVYVPSLGGRWPEPGGPYDKVIQELAQGPPPLLRVDLGAWNSAPGGSPKAALTAGSGSPRGNPGESRLRTKASLSAKGTRTRTVPPQGGQDCSAPAVPASPEAPTPSLSDPSSEKGESWAAKGKRTLRKPQRVPSIYKLKLRPRLRPRRDHRPEKRPSRIPKPLTYFRLGPTRAPPGGRLVTAALGSKGGVATPGKGASAGEEEEGKQGSKPAAPLESSPQPLEGQGKQRLQVSLSPEEESWV